MSIQTQDNGTMNFSTAWASAAHISSPPSMRTASSMIGTSASQTVDAQEYAFSG